METMIRYKRPNFCQFLRKDIETCKIGNKEMNIKIGNSCPFDYNEEAIKDCNCYK